MRISSLIQKGNTTGAGTVQSALQARLDAEPYDCVRVAMAYVSIAGVRALLSAFGDRRIRKSEWLVGLDDAVTQPGAIDLLLDLENAEVRVASLARHSLRFHPKICLFQLLSGSAKELLMIGSANLTRSALAGNCEAVVFLQPDTSTDRSLFTRIWADLWSHGHRPTNDELGKYRARYEAARKIRRKLKQLPRKNAVHEPTTVTVILEGDHAELDPSQAQTCWIECGFITAMGRELEFKAEQGLFFGLAATGGPQGTFRFRTSNGSIATLRMKYQQNHMWRLQMNNDIPEVRTGLRPKLPDGKLGRSSKVAVFTRTEHPDLFDLRFVALGSKSHKNLKERSRRYGTIGRTSARSYGWC